MREAVLFCVVALLISPTAFADTGAPPPVTGLVATPGYAEVHLSWDAVSTIDPPAEYEIERSVADGPWQWIAVVSLVEQLRVGTSHLDEGAPMGVDLSYRIRAVALDGAVGPWSDVVSATWQRSTLLPPVTDVSVGSEPGIARIKWRPAGGPFGELNRPYQRYDIYRGWSHAEGVVWGTTSGASGHELGPNVELRHRVGTLLVTPENEERFILEWIDENVTFPRASYTVVGVDHDGRLTERSQEAEYLWLPPLPIGMPRVDFGSPRGRIDICGPDPLRTLPNDPLDCNIYVYMMVRVDVNGPVKLLVAPEGGVSWPARGTPNPSFGGIIVQDSAQECERGVEAGVTPFQSVRICAE